MLFRPCSNPRSQNLDLLLALCDWPGKPVRHVLGSAAEIHRRVNGCGERTEDVANDLGFRRMTVVGVARLMAVRAYSPERLACTAMRDPGLNDEDIAEIFSRSERWARIVREQWQDIVDEEPMDPDLEWFDPDFQRDDPLPDEIQRRANALRVQDREPPRCDVYRAGLRSFSWNRRNAAFIRIGVA